MTADTDKTEVPNVFAASAFTRKVSGPYIYREGSRKIQTIK